MNAATRRLFFALWPDAEVRDRLAATARSVALHPSARRVRHDKLHITLAFLGSTPAPRQACFEQAAEQVHGQPFQLHLDRFGHFPRARVFWLGPSETPPALRTLVEELVAAIEPCGFERETRPYRVHLTLARKVRRRPRAPDTAVAWCCGEFCLVESADGDYRVLRRWSLG